MRRPIALLLLTLLLLPAGPARAEGEGKPLDEVLRGRILSLEGSRVAIRYDFSDPAELSDWAETRPFRIAGALRTEHVDKALRIEGAGGFCLRVLFEGEVSIAFELRPLVPRDLGAVVMEEPRSDDFVLFSVNDLHFQKFDRAKRPGHMITRFRAHEPGTPADALPFRYVARGKAPSIRPGEPIRVTARKSGGEDTLVVGGKTYSGFEEGRKLGDLRVGVYAAGSCALVDRVVVEGKLSPGWLESEGADLRLAKPVTTESAEAQAERAAAELLAGFAAGTTPARDLLPVVGDPDVTEEVRERAAAAVAETKDRALARNLLPLLASYDAVTRKLAATLLRPILGKTFGYSPRASRKRRRAAIEKIEAHLEKGDR